MRRRAVWIGSRTQWLIAGWLAVFLLSPSASLGQNFDQLPDTLRGRVVLNGRPLPAVPVALHRVTPDTSGAVATAISADDGSFVFALNPLPDAAFNVFFVTAEHLSVRYFGEPVHLAEPGVPYTVAVADTSSAVAEPIRIVRRDMVLLPQINDSWEVNEIIGILNPNPNTLVGSGGMPSLEIEVPTGAMSLLAGQGEILPNEVSFMENRVLLLTPVIPGRRELWIRYMLPARPARADIPLQQPTDTFNLYVEQPSHLNSVEGLGTTQMIEVEGEQYLQYAGLGLAAGGSVILQWSGGLPVDPVLVAVSITLVLLAAGVFMAFRNRRPAAA